MSKQLMSEPIVDMNYKVGGLVSPQPPTHPILPDQAHGQGHYTLGGTFHSPTGQPLSKQDGAIMRPLHPAHFMSGGLAGANPMQGSYVDGGSVSVDPKVPYADGGMPTNPEFQNDPHYSEAYASGGGIMGPSRTGYYQKGIKEYSKGGMVNTPGTIGQNPDDSYRFSNGGAAATQTLTTDRYASGGGVGDPTSGLGGILGNIPGYGTTTGGFAGEPTPGQKNGWAGMAGSVIGSLIGDYYGGPIGGEIGSFAGKQVGNEAGNMIAGRDAFNGKTGDFWDNFNPFSKYGAASIGQGLNNAQSSMNMPQQMLGSIEQGLPGLGGGGGGLPGGLGSMLGTGGIGVAGGGLGSILGIGGGGSSGSGSVAANGPIAPMAMGYGKGGLVARYAEGGSVGDDTPSEQEMRSIKDRQIDRMSQTAQDNMVIYPGSLHHGTENTAFSEHPPVQSASGIKHKYNMGKGFANGGAANFNPNSAGYADGGPLVESDQQPQQADQQQSMQNQQIANQVVPKDGTSDQVDAKLSKGEFVMDAATVQFWGMGKLIQMQDKAHEAIAKHLEKQNAQQQQQAPQPQQGLGAKPPPMPTQLPPQAAAQPTATQQRIQQSATPPKPPAPSPSPFSLGG